MKTIFIVGCLFLIPHFALAQESPLTQTEDLLTNKPERNKAIQETPQGVQADHQLDAIAHGDDKTKEDMYKISAEVLAELAAKTGNDPEKLKALVEQAQKNPEAFFNSLSEKSKRKIRGVSSTIQKKDAAKP